MEVVLGVWWNCWKTIGYKVLILVLVEVVLGVKQGDMLIVTGDIVLILVLVEVVLGV